MPTIDRRIPLSLTFGTVLAMVAITGWQGYQLWQTESSRSPLTMATETDDSEARTESSVPDVEWPELAFFGSASPTQSAPEAETENLPETNLRLVLRGALAADGEFPGSALIEDPDGETNVYMVGETLPGNALLRTVLPGRVILERDGKLENLYFPETESQGGVDVVSDQQTEPTARPEQSPASTPTTGAPSDEQARREEIRSRLQQLRERLQDNN